MDRDMFFWKLTGIAATLEALAHVACAQGAAGRSARLLGASDALREALTTPLHGSDALEHRSAVSAAREMLGDSAYAAAYAEGQSMTPADAVKYAVAGKTHEPSAAGRER